MKASKLIKKLQKAIDKYGDLKVTHFTIGEDYVQGVVVYDQNGNPPKGDNGPYEIFLH